MNFYPHHIGDYMTATAHLTWLEDAAYRRLLDLYYSREQAIPADLVQACRLVRASSKDERKAVETVLNEFFTASQDGWRHGRCDEEIVKARDAAERARANGKKGGRPAKEKPTANPEETQSVISGNPEKSNSQAPITNTNTNKEPQTPQAGLTAKPKGIALQTFIADCKTKGERPLRDYSPLWDYAEAAGLHADFVALAWAEFCRRFMPGGAKEGRLQKDWRKTFRNYVENNYFKLWAIDKDGNYFLTTQGKQAEKFQESKAAA